MNMNLNFKELHQDNHKRVTRRQFFGSTASGLGLVALSSLLQNDLLQGEEARNAIGGLNGLPHFAPKAKRVVLL